jgi:hypothetical protein
MTQQPGDRVRVDHDDGTTSYATIIRVHARGILVRYDDGRTRTVAWWRLTRP